MSNTESDENDIKDVIRIMVATDNHLGYAEKDVVRGEDSFTAFEEIMQLAANEEVDLILLGGDLFHDAVPSQNALHKCIDLLRRYTFGDKPVALEILSDQTECFHNAVNRSVNYEDPNLNIGIPVFSIHGNHDDPSGFGRLSSLDLLSTMGLVNYFGRWTDLTKVEISPILIRKGETTLALYGLSHIHDARLARMFHDCQVTINSDNKCVEDWFNLMVVHQNRADRGTKNYLQEKELPGFLNLVIWGHEHDCRIEPELNVLRDFYVSQPGSSVATSLARGESLKKHVGILTIYKTKFHIKPLPLQTVRPFIFDSVNLADYADRLNLDEGDATTKVFEFAKERVEAMIEQAKSLLTGHPKQPTLPLIRLRLQFTEESHMFNVIRFSNMFSERVANAADVVKFDKIIKRVGKDGFNADKETSHRAAKEDSAARVEELMARYLEENNTLKLMHPKALAEVISRMVKHSDYNALDAIYKIYNDKALEHLMETLPDEENVDEELANFRLRYDADDMLKMLHAPGASTAGRSAPKSSDTPTTSSARGRVRGRGAAASRVGVKMNVSSDNTRASNKNETLLGAVTRGRNPRSKAKVVVISDSE